MLLTKTNLLISFLKGLAVILKRMNKPDVTIAVDGNEKMLFVKLVENDFYIKYLF